MKARNKKTGEILPFIKYIDRRGQYNFHTIDIWYSEKEFNELYEIVEDTESKSKCCNAPLKKYLFGTSKETGAIFKDKCSKCDNVYPFAEKFVEDPNHPYVGMADVINKFREDNNIDIHSEVVKNGVVFNETMTTNWIEEFKNNIPSTYYPKKYDEDEDSETKYFGYKHYCGQTKTIYTIPDWGNIQNFITTLLEKQREEYIEMIEKYDFKERHICRFNDGKQNCECCLKTRDDILTLIKSHER